MICDTEKDVYHAEADIWHSQKKFFESFAMNQLSHYAGIEAGIRMIREQQLLDAIGKFVSHFPVPKPMGMVWQEGTLIAVTSFVAGIPLELRSERSPVERPWEIVGKIAAEIHRFPVTDLPADLKRFSIWREHVERTVRKFEKHQVPEIQEGNLRARAFALFGLV
jgi:hypothetical protein